MGMLYEIAQRLKNAKVQVHLNADSYTEKKGDSNDGRGKETGATDSFVVELSRQATKSETRQR